MTRKRHSAWPFAIASVVLMALPSPVAHKTRVTGLAAFIPLRLLADETHDLGERAWNRVRPGSGDDDLQRQNEYYRDLVVQLHARNIELSEQLASATGLKGIAREGNYQIVVADVILNLDASSFRQTLVISAGTREGVERGQLVLFHNHLVGRVLEAGPYTSKVQLVTDSGFRAGAVSVPKTATDGVAFARRDVGVFEGNGAETGVLKWIAGETPVEEGNYVVTTEDPINDVPKGLILGKVSSLSRGRGPYPRVEVTPIIDPRGLEFVLVLRRRE